MLSKLILFCSIITLSFAIEWEKDNGVIVLTKHNIESAITDFPALLVEFYAPWCPHC